MRYLVLGMSSYLELIKLMLISALALLLVSCGGGSSSDLNVTSTYENNGVAQKGPFSVGSSVIIDELDSFGRTTSQPIESKVSEKNGKFTFETLDTDSTVYYRIKVSGTFFNEKTGLVSGNPITLSAITNNPKNSSINVLTHWLSNRADTLLSSGMMLQPALDQSQKEIIKIFGISNSNALDITANSTSINEDNAMLLLLSGALMDASSKYQVSSHTIIDEIGSDFADDGLLNEKGNNWFIRLQSLIKDNPRAHARKYANKINEKLGYKLSVDINLPPIIPLASRPVANIPLELFAEPSETITLDGSDSHDSGDIINFTWFRVDQQTQYDVQVSDRFSSKPTITVPDEATVLAAPNREISLLYALVVTDADKLTHTGVVKVTVKLPPPLNNPPEAISQFLVTDEDLPIAITLSANDIDGDSINYVLNTPLATTNGIVELDTTLPKIIYIPTKDYSGPDSFTFIVNDGFENSNTARIDIQVNPINDPPLADAGFSQAVESLQTVNLDGSRSTDVDGTVDEYLWEQQLTGVPVVSLNSSSISNPSFIAPSISSVAETLTFNLVVTDNEGANSIADSVDILVNPSNQAPVANAGRDQSVTSTRINTSGGSYETTPVIILDGSGSTDLEDDLNSLPLNYNWTQMSGPTSIDPAELKMPTIKITGDVGEDIDGIYVFRLTVTDSGGLISDSDDVTIMVSPTPTAIPPTADDLTIAIDLLGNPTDITLMGNDPDGNNNNLIYEIITLPDFGNLNVLQGPITGNVVEYLAFSIPSPDSLRYRVKDEQGLFSNEATVNLTVPNTPPTANSFSVNTNQGFDISVIEGPGEIEGFDIDGGTLTVVDVTDPTNGVLTVTNSAGVNTYTYSPNASFFGVDAFTYKINDGMDSSPIATVTINVNARPIANAGFDRTVTQGDSVTLSGSGSSDQEGPIKTYEWSQDASDPDQVTLNSANTETPSFTAPIFITGDPDKVLNFDLYVTDQEDFRSLVDSVKVTVTEECVTNKPIATTGVDRHVESGTEVTLYGFGLADQSCAGENFADEKIWTQLDITTDTDVNLDNSDPYSNPSFIAPTVSATTVLRFQLMINDQVSSSPPSDPEVVLVTVYPVGSTSLPENDPPIATGVSSDYNVVVLGNGNALTIQLKAIDPDGDQQGLTYRIVSTTTNERLDDSTASDGYVRYTPDYPVADNDSFSFIATDQDNNDSEEITVNITRIMEPAGNNPPVVTGDTFTGSVFDSRIDIQLDEDDYVVEPDANDFYTLVEVTKDEANGVIFEGPYNFSSGRFLRATNERRRTPGIGEYTFFAVDKYGKRSANEATFFVIFN